MTTISNLPPTYWENFTHLATILYCKHPPSLSQCTSVTSCPCYVSLKQPNLLYLPEFFILKLKKPVTELRTLFLCLFWIFWLNKLNLSATETPFQEETWPSPSQLTFLTVNNVRSFTQALTYMPSGSHRIGKIIWTLIHNFKKLFLEFSIKNWILQRCLRRNSEFLLLFTISTLSNNDIIHGVSGYFKCR